MKKLTYAVAGAAMTALLSGTALAAPSTSNSVGMANVNALNANNGWNQTILSTSIKTSEQKDVIAGVSLECGLYTRTKVAGQKGQKSSSTAAAKVEVRVVVDKGTAMERVAAPGWVTFCEREQTLSATLGGVLEECNVILTDADGDGVPDSGHFTSDDCTFTDEDIELALRTMGAHHFNYILLDLGTNGPDGHTVDVEARVSTNETGDDAAGGSYEAEANGAIGNGSLVVDEVRLAKGISF